jgi:hypothetical protein
MNWAIASRDLGVYRASYYRDVVANCKLSESVNPKLLSRL